MEETESVEITKLPGKQGMSSNYTDSLPTKDEQALLTPKCESDSNSVWPAEVEEPDVHESEKDEDGDTEFEDDEARSQSSEKRRKEYSTREVVVLA